MPETILAPPGSEANKRSIEEKLLLGIDAAKDAQANMQLLLDKSNADLGASDIKAVAREVKTLSRIVRLLCKDTLEQYASDE